MGRYTNSRGGRSPSVERIWRLYRMFAFFPQVASANTALRQSTGTVLPFCLGLPVRFADWVQTSPRHSNKKCCKGTSMCFEQDLCTIPSECVKPVKLWLAFRHNLNTANLIVSMLSTRNGLPTAVCSFTHSFIFFFL